MVVRTSSINFLMLKSFFSGIPRFFSVFFVLFFVTAFFVFADSFRVYRATAELVVTSQTAAIPTSVAAETIAAFPSTLSFYERLLSDHERIEDPWIEESRIDRKEAWTNVVLAQVVPGTSLIRLSIVSPDPEQSAALLNASIETLYGFSGRLYDRNKQVDIRLVEGALVQSVFQQIGVLVLMSVLLAGMLAFLVSKVLAFSFRGFSFPSFRANMFFRAQRPVKSLQPVGAFPDLPSVRSDRADVATGVPTDSSSDSSRQERGVSHEESKVSEVPESISPQFQTEIQASSSGSVAIEESVAPDSTSEESQVPFLENMRESDEPHDIWEKSSHLSRGPLRIRSSKPASPEVEETSKSGEGAISSRFASVTSGGTEASRFAPGNLETISARDFSWEKYLFQNRQTSREADTVEAAETSPDALLVSAAPEKREPSPEELKARLNQLLRGEL